MVSAEWPPDGGYGWIIVIASLGLNMLAIACTATFSVFYVSFIQVFNINKTQGALVHVFQLISFAVTAFPVGVVIKHLTARVVAVILTSCAALGFLLASFATETWHLYITYGLLTGVAFGGLAGSANVATQQYFDKKRSLVCGIISVGFGAGYMVWSPVSQYLIDTFGWRGALMIISGIYIHGIPLGLLLRPPPVPKKNPTATNSNSILTIKQYLADAVDVSIFKNKRFLAINVGMFFIQAGVIVPDVFIHLRAVEDGVDPQASSLLLMVVGLASILGRVVFGWLGDMERFNRMMLMGVGILIDGALTSVSCLFKGYPFLMGYAVMLGLLSPAFTSLHFVICRDIVGVEKYAPALGFQLTLNAVAMICGIQLGGVIADLETTSMVFLIMGVVMMFGAVLVCTVALLYIKQNRKQYTVSNMQTLNLDTFEGRVIHI